MLLFILVLRLRLDLGEVVVCQGGVNGRLVLVHRLTLILSYLPQHLHRLDTASLKLPVERNNLLLEFLNEYLHLTWRQDDHLHGLVFYEFDALSER